ncbi:hypothetical protein [Pseudalkalibacillus hwajinpoensis]|uniref:hypothetical protein n=1 Tax=Guptibacillus hwajinpoensis TaxID=208199 RepID=UPI00192894F5|nr:hypothetical protein [Pseudalkalibacillus hwajinpoensis]
MEGNVNTAPRPERSCNGLAVSSIVLGIIGLVLLLIPLIPYPLAILAIIFGVIGKKKPVKKGFAIAV